MFQINSLISSCRLERAQRRLWWDPRATLEEMKMREEAWLVEIALNKVQDMAVTKAAEAQYWTGERRIHILHNRWRLLIQNHKFCLEDNKNSISICSSSRSPAATAAISVAEIKNCLWISEEHKLLLSMPQSKRQDRITKTTTAP